MGRNAQMRRFRRDLDKNLNHKGLTQATPHPFGNRAFRRSKEGKLHVALMLEKLKVLTLQQLKEEDDNRNPAEA